MSINQQTSSISNGIDGPSDVKMSDGSLLEEHAKCISKLLTNEHLQSLLKDHEKLKQQASHCEKQDYIGLCMEIMKVLEEDKSDESLELLNILNKPSLRCLIEAHDNILHQTYVPLTTVLPEACNRPGAIMKVIGLSTSANKPLGLTLGKHADNCIYIKDIMKGSMIEMQDLLNIGDIIKEVNGQEIGDDIKQIMTELEECKDSITLKVLPPKKQEINTCEMYVRCHFHYNPAQDDPLDGLAFSRGDILKIVDQSDPNWWKASHVSEDVSQDDEIIGSVPSLILQQSRNHCYQHLPQAFFGKNKKKVMYRTSKSSAFDCLDVRAYEEVTKMPPIERKVVVFIGAQNIGRKALKSRLVNTYPDKFGVTTPATSRQLREGEESGRGYVFLARDEMMVDIRAGKYFEYGEYSEEMYGTRLDSVRNVVNAGKICLLDCNASALKVLKTAEFMPLVVFIEAPSIDVLSKENLKEFASKKLTPQQLREIVRESKEIREMYAHYFDVTICHKNVELTYAALLECLESAASESQWVPVSWVY